jgi:micrococcal nuclease
MLRSRDWMSGPPHGEGCPRCGYPRGGFFRYCLECGLDFDELPSPPDREAADVAASEPPEHRAEPIAALAPNAIRVAGTPSTPASPAAVRAAAVSAPTGAPAPTERAGSVRTASSLGTRPGAAPMRRRAARPGSLGQVVRFFALILAAVVTVAVLENVGTSASGEPATSPAAVGDATPSGASPMTTLPATAGSGALPGPSGPSASASVRRIIDGDTIEVDIDGVPTTVRYIGIDAPEIDDPAAPLLPLATVAAATNASLVEGHEVILERDVSETDRFGRLLRHVWVEADGGWVLVGLELLRLGLAQVSTFPPDVKYVDLMTDAQEAARTEGIGIWDVAAAIPTPTGPGVVGDEPLAVTATERVTIMGGSGSYTWSTVTFETDRLNLRWDVGAPPAATCELEWRIEPVDGEILRSTARVDAGQRGRDNRQYEVGFGQAAFVVSGDCADWVITLQGYEASAGFTDCDPSYPEVCLPPYPPDLDCRQVAPREFVVRGPDPHGFDPERDGVGCGSGG